MGNATIPLSMSPLNTTHSTEVRPRIGVPWRTTREEQEQKRQKLDYYFSAVRLAGAEPVEISLQLSPDKLREQISHLDGFILPGSPSDVEPRLYGAVRRAETAEADLNRDKTDVAILEQAFREEKPVFAICYGCQALNVFLGGSLIQDIPSQLSTALIHGKTDLAPAANTSDLQHQVLLVPGSLLAELNGSETAAINTSHHQAIANPGKDLRVTAQAPDGIVEGVEWTGDNNWVVGVQWHPERMVGNAFAERLFAAFVAAVRTSRAAHNAVTQSR